MFAIICVGSTLGILYAISNLVLIPYLMQKLGDMQAASLVFSAGILCTAFVAPLVGSLVDLFRKEMLFIFILVLVVILSLFGIMTPAKPMVVFSGFLIVLCTFSFLIPYSALVSDQSEDYNRTKNFGISTGVVNISLFGASILVSLFGKYNSNVTLKLLIVILSILALIMSIHRKKNIVRSICERQLRGRANARVTTNYFALGLYLCIYFFFWAAYGGIIPYLTSFLTDNVIINETMSPIWVGGLTLLSGVSGIFTGKCVKHFSQKKLFLLSSFLAALVCGLMLFSYSLVTNKSIFTLFWFIWFLGFGITSGFLCSMVNSLLSSLAQKNDQGKIFGIGNVVNVCSQSLSVGLIGRLIAKGNYQPMFLIAFLCFLVVLLLSSILFNSQLIVKKENNN